MEKSREAFRTISEVSELLDIPAHVLRFWESKFSQIKPVKRGGGRRYYRPDDINLLRGIRGLLYTDGLTIKGAQKLIKEKGVRHVIALGMESEETRDVLAGVIEKRRAATRAAEPASPKQPGLFETPGAGAEPTAAETAIETADTAVQTAPEPGLDRETLSRIIERLRALRDSMRS